MHINSSCLHYSGQPSLVSGTVTVADMSSSVIGLSVTVTLVIVISVTIVIISLVVIIVLCHRQGTYGDKDHDPLYVCVCDVCAMFSFSLYAASYKVKGPPPRQTIIKWRTPKESNRNQIPLTRLLPRHD